MQEKFLMKEVQQRADAVLLSSRENKYSVSGLYSGSGYVLLCEDETFVLVDGRYYTEMQQKNKTDTICLLDKEHPFEKVLDSILEKKQVQYLGFENTIEFSTYKELERNIKPTLVDLDLQGMRCIKRPEEIEIIRSACRIAAEAYTTLLS